MPSRKVFLVLGCWLCLCSELFPHPLSPLLPDTGQGAIAQKKIDLRGGLVVLSIAIAPGFEDIPSLAYFRLKEGAGVGCVYITNGEDLPNYECGNNAYETAKQRKEEAYQVMSQLHGEAFFLNVPATDCLSIGNDTGACDKYFSRLDTIISSMKPDIILINSDYIFLQGNSKRLQTIEKKIEAALTRLKESSRWNEATVFVQSTEMNRGDRLYVEELNVQRKKTYRDIAQDVLMQYRSLKPMVPAWKKSYQPRYSAVFPKGAGRRKISEFHSPSIPPRLKALALSVQEIARSQEGQSTVDQLNRLHDAIAEIDYFINHSKNTLSPQEKKLLLYWNSTLEECRCALHHVSIPYSLRDERVTASQIFYVNIGSLGSWIKNGKTSIIFPGAIERKWIVDLRQDYTYPLRADTSWLVLSPEGFPLTSPVNEEGYGALQMRNKFTFMVVHEEKQPVNNFVYQKDIPLIGVPSHSLELLNRDVFANRDTAVVVKIRNNLYNAMKGEVQAEDSLVSVAPYHISLVPKSTVIDSLILHWKTPWFYGEHEIILKNQKNNPVGSFICKGMELHTHGRCSVGVFSTIDQSPLTLALHRIGYPSVNLTPVEDKSRIDSISTIFIDEGSSKILDSYPERREKLKNWITAGGKMVVFPQYDPHANHIPDDSVVFKYNNAIISMTEVRVDTAYISSMLQMLWTLKIGKTPVRSFLMGKSM